MVTPGRDHEVEMWLLPGLILGAAVIAVAVWFPAQFAHAASHTRSPGNPLTYGLRLTRDKATWPRQATPWAAAEGLVLVPFLVIALVYLVRRPRRHRVDRSARSLIRHRGDREFTRPSGPALEVAGPGPLLGRVVPGGAQLRATWEQVTVVMAGARMGKTSSVVIPMVLRAPGAVFTTSNKPDVVVLTEPIRQSSGDTWVFDPQGLAGLTQPTFWWDPLDLARTRAGAEQLAAIFIDSTYKPTASTDAYFHPEGEALLTRLLLAAALGDQGLPVVASWLSSREFGAATTALRAGGHPLAAAGVDEIDQLPDRQREGVVGTAAKALRWLEDPARAAWITPSTRLPRFHAEQFVCGTDTFYALSKEGAGSAQALTAALTAAVCDAAERHAATSPHGRLPMPLMAILDEAANCVRWRHLPDLYSHYGSRGIVLVSVLQSPAQAIQAWGREGWHALWSAANVRLYAGGVVDHEFLEQLSQLCGDHEVTKTSTSAGVRQARSTQWSTQKERIFPVADLAALPRGRAVALLSGAAPKLIELQPWYDDRTLVPPDRNAAVVR